MERIPTISSLYLRIAQSGVQTGPNFMAIAVSGQMLRTYWAVQCSLMFSLPPAFFSKVMQSDELDIVGALTSLLRTIKETEKLRSLPLAQWPVYFATMKKLKE